jgi:hypothetical protein
LLGAIPGPTSGSSPSDLPQQLAEGGGVGEAAGARIKVEGEPVRLVERAQAAVHQVDWDAAEIY